MESVTQARKTMRGVIPRPPPSRSTKRQEKGKQLSGLVVAALVERGAVPLGGEQTRPRDAYG